MGSGTVFIISFVSLVAIPSQAKYTQFYHPGVNWVFTSEICSAEAFMNCVKVQSLVALDLVWTCPQLQKVLLKHE